MSEEEEVKPAPKQNGVTKKDKKNAEKNKKQAEKSKKPAEKVEAVEKKPAAKKNEKNKTEKVQKEQKQKGAASPQKKVIEGGVIIEELKEGNGQLAKPGKLVQVFDGDVFFVFCLFI